MGKPDPSHKFQLSFMAMMINIIVSVLGWTPVGWAGPVSQLPSLFCCDESVFEKASEYVEFASSVASMSPKAIL